MKKNRFKNKKRVVVKIGSSSLTHPKTGNLDFITLERLVRELCDLRNQDIDVCQMCIRDRVWSVLNVEAAVIYVLQNVR